MTTFTLWEVGTDKDFLGMAGKFLNFRQSSDEQSTQPGHGCATYLAIC